MMLYMVGPDKKPVVRTPAEERQHRKDIDSLTMRFGEWYRIWQEGELWFAERDGDKLHAESPLVLAVLVADHMANLKWGAFSESGP